MLNKKIIGCAIASMFLFGGIVNAIELTETPNTNDDYYLTINGESQSEQPLAYEGRTLVPIRVISEKLGAKVDYNAQTQDIKIEKEGVVINLKVGSTQAQVNGVTKTLDVPASVKDGRTFVPVRFVSEALNTKVNYNSARREVVIGENKVVNGVKIPAIHLAKEQAVAVTGDGGWVSMQGNEIQGTIIAKYGDASTKMHTYGCINQEQYDKVVNAVKSAIKKVDASDFTTSSGWIYLQAYLENPNLPDSYKDPRFEERQGLDYNMGKFKRDNKKLVLGLEKGWITPEEAEQVVILGVVRGVVRGELNLVGAGVQTPGEKLWSAYQYIFEHKKDCDSSSQYDLVIADILGYNGAIFGSPGHAWFSVGIGNYWYDNGSSPNMGISSNIYNRVDVVETPTHDMSQYYRP